MFRRGCINAHTKPHLTTSCFLNISSNDIHPSGALVIELPIKFLLRVSGRGHVQLLIMLLRAQQETT